MNSEIKSIYFIIGAHKTGITSITNVFTSLGFKTQSWDLDYSKKFYLKEPDIMKTLNSMIQHRVNRGLPMIFSDSPWNHFNNYEKINKFYENSKFVLTIRDSNKWFGSVIRWVRRGGKFGQHRQVHRMYGHLYNCENIIYKNKKQIIDKYEKRNTDIIKYFKDKPNKLLIIDIEKDNCSKICKFLNKPIINKPFPHLNKNNKYHGE